MSDPAFWDRTKGEMMKTNIRFGLSVMLAAILLVSMAFVPAVSAKEVNNFDGGGISVSKHVSKPELLLNESDIGIRSLSNPNPSTNGLTLIGSDASDTSNIYGQQLMSYRMYSVDNENDPDYDYFVIWVQSTDKLNAPLPLKWIKTGIKDINNGEIVDWSPSGTVYTESGETKTLTLGLSVPVVASISQTFTDPDGKLYPNVFTTTQFESKWSASGTGTLDAGFNAAGVQIKSPAGKCPSFTWYASANEY